MGEAKGRMVLGSLQGGATNHGHLVKFDLTLEGGGEEVFFCEAQRYATLVGKLCAYGKMAEQVRRASPGQQVEITAPFRIEKVLNSGFSDNPRVAVITFATTDGIPLQIALSVADAEKTIQRLTREIGRLAVHKGPGPAN